ncbi:uncharacterized protein LOC109829957 isoform X2 [Asparagus officinalis]|uniref:uncharacterized protein LOC109829957 isoform X2 n=1 Tax=Asparagus officinalis TaxID=4686 RepID=UPI00098DEAE2|nr:uncharacterized protein LOC109829957 isoform X2 [Asparagus officinalis]
MTEEREAPMLQSPMTGSLDDEMEEKENLCSVQEDKIGALMQRNRNKKVGGCNLRKSLAWNQAFFTEEGVLDQMELSFLSRSTNKSSDNLASVSEMSPLTEYSKSNIKPPPHGPVTNSKRKDSRPRKLFSSSNEEPEAHGMTSGKKPSAKGIFRNIPRSPSTHSQKRVANVSRVNPTSKLPKFTPAKLHLPFPTTSKNVTTKSSKTDHSAVKVNVGQNASARLSNAKMDLACSSSSSKFSAENHGKILAENYTATSKTITNRSSSSKLHVAVSCAPAKAAPLLPQSQDSGGHPPPTNARPSALRMPSPSLGFFRQEKVSPSYRNQNQGQTQPSECKISSLSKPMNLRPIGYMRPLTTSVGLQNRKGTGAANPNAASVISSSSQACLASSCLKPPVPRDIYLRTETNSEINRGNVVSRVQLGSDLLLVDQDINEQSVVSPSQNPDFGRVREIEHGASSPKMSSESFVQSIQQFSKINVPGDNCDDYPPQEDSNSDLSCSKESHLYSELQEHDSKEVQGVFREHILSKMLDDKVVRDRTYSISTEKNLSAGNSNFSCHYPVTFENKQSVGASVFPSDLELLFTARSNLFDASTEADLSIGKESPSAYSSNSFEADIPLSSSSGICSHVAASRWIGLTSEPNSNLLEKHEPVHIEEMEFQDSRPHCDTIKAVSSRKQDLSMCEHTTGTDASRGEVLPNAVPFSDEWVAALEALGEDILEKKTGPVQHSPPDKALPEPSPWSPVKKKAQDIGPYDCTKYSKNLQEI